MTKYTVKNVPNNQTVVHDSDARTWGELSKEISEIHGDDVIRPGMKVVLRSNRNELSAESELPSGQSETSIALFATKLDAGHEH